MSDAEQAEVMQSVDQTKQASSDGDFNRLVNIVYGYTQSRITVKSALNIELIWCSPGSFIRGNEDEKHSVILTQGFYLGKYEVTRQEYLKVIGTNPRKLKGDKVLIERVS